VSARARIGLGGAALLGPLVAFPTLFKPELAIGLCLAVGVAFLASRSVAYPLGLWALPGVLLGLAGNSVPSGSTQYFLVGWLGLSLLLAMVREEHVLPLRVLLAGPVLLTIGLAVVMLARLGSSADESYGSYKLQLFLAENVTFLVAGIVVARARRHLDLWLGLSLATMAAGSLVLLRKLLSGEATDVLPGRLALYAEGGPISLARGAATGILLAVFLLLASRQAWRRTAALAVIPVLGVAFIGAGSRGPVVGLAAGLLILLALTLGDRVSRRRLLLLGVAVVVSAVLIPQLVPGQNISRSLSVLVGQSGQDVGGGDLSNGRLQLWNMAWHSFGEHPLLGLGTGGFASVSPVGIYPHNVFLEAAAEYGILGLVLVAGLVAFAFFHAGRAWSASEGGDRHHAALVLAYLGAAVVNAQFSGDFTNNGEIWLGAGLALGLLQRVAPPSPDYEPLRRLQTRWRRRGDGPPGLVMQESTGPLPPLPPERSPRPSAAAGPAILSPAEGSIVQGDVLVGFISDGSEAVVLQLSRDGREWEAIAEAANDSSPDRRMREAIWATGELSDGEYRLRLVTTEVGGRETAGPETRVLVANRRPAIHFATAPPSAAVREAIELEDPGEHLSGRVALRAFVREESKTAGAEFHAAAAGTFDWQSLGSVEQPPFRLELDTGRLADGLYDLRVVARDAEGGIDASRIVRERRIDNTPPAVQLEEPGTGLTVGGIVRLRASAMDAGSGVTAVGFEWTQDSLTWVEVATSTVRPYVCSWDTTRLVDGLYRLRAFALDGATNKAFAQPVELEVWNGLFAQAEDPATSLDAATLWQLERLLERCDLSLERRDELEALLYTLRPYALTDGTIPQRFWPLLAESFGDLLQS
jgi:O-antigen ligase